MSARAAATGDWAQEGEAFVQELEAGILPIVTAGAGVAILFLAGVLLFSGRIDTGWIFRILLAGALLSFGVGAWEVLVT